MLEGDDARQWRQGGAGKKSPGGEKEDGRMSPGHVSFSFPFFFFKGTQTKLHKVRVQRRRRRMIQFCSGARGGSQAVRIPPPAPFIRLCSGRVFSSAGPPFPLILLPPLRCHCVQTLQRRGPARRWGRGLTGRGASVG